MRRNISMFAGLCLLLLGCTGDAKDEPAATPAGEQTLELTTEEALRAQADAASQRIGMDDLDVPTGPDLSADSFYGECNALRNADGDIETGLDSEPGYWRLFNAHYWIEVTTISQLDRDRFAERDLWVDLTGTVTKDTEPAADSIEMTLHPLEVGALQWAQSNGYDSLVGVVEAPSIPPMTAGMITIVFTPDGFIVPGPCSKFLVEPSLRDRIDGDPEPFLQSIPTLTSEELMTALTEQQPTSDTLQPEAPPTIANGQDRAFELNRSQWLVDSQEGIESHPGSEFVTIFEIGSPSDHIWFQDRCANSSQIEWLDGNSFRFVAPRPDVTPIDCRPRGGDNQALGLLGVVGQTVSVEGSRDRLTLEGTGSAADPELPWVLNLVRVESDQHGTHHSIGGDPTADPRMIVSGEDYPGSIDAAHLENGRILITTHCVVFLSDHTGDEVTLAFASNATEFDPATRRLRYLPSDLDLTEGMLVSAIPTWELDARDGYFLPVQKAPHSSCPPAVKVVAGIRRR